MTEAAPPMNKNGQVLGPKGRRSRERIIAETVALLAETPVTDLNMALIVRRAGITPAAYYLYFEDVGEAMLAALEAPTAEFIALGLGPLVAPPWPQGKVYDCALAFVNAYFGIWKRHIAVLRARNVLADAADPRFEAIRAAASATVTAALADQLAARPCRGHADLVEPRLLASALHTAVERSAIVTALDLHGRSVESEETSRALAHLFELSLEAAAPSPGSGA
jgi:AcrR family transcriptional regulator